MKLTKRYSFLIQNRINFQVNKTLILIVYILLDKTANFGLYLANKKKKTFLQLKHSKTKIMHIKSFAI